MKTPIQDNNQEVDKISETLKRQIRYIEERLTDMMLPEERAVLLNKKIALKTELKNRKSIIEKMAIGEEAL